MARRAWRLRAAWVAGAALRVVGRGVPGVAGPLLVAVGLGLAWLPLGVVAAGLILWLVDLRIPDEQPRPVSGDPRRPGNRRRMRAVA